jgi:predicted N-acetyltransferase YhbS
MAQLGQIDRELGELNGEPGERRLETMPAAESVAGPASGAPLFRAARAGDAHAIAALHADSWQRHYRGAYSDAFLDGDVNEYQRAKWATRLSEPDPRARTIVAELGGEIVGFAHLQLDDHPAWGSLLDNLHVTYGLKGQRIGTRLLALTGQAVLDSSPASGLYLWVLGQNSAAQAFYEARGGRCVEHAQAGPPDDDPTRLSGRPEILRYAWADPSELAGRA